MSYGPAPAGASWHRSSRKHNDAARLIEYVAAEGGSTTKSHREIRTDLGLSPQRYFRAKQHSAKCGPLGHIHFAYRRYVGGINVLAMFDPSGSMTLTEPITGRTNALYQGTVGRNIQHDTTVERNAAMWEAASMEALARGNKPLSDAYSQASSDILATGAISAGTIGWLASLGAI